jgi:predicted exporter
VISGQSPGQRRALALVLWLLAMALGGWLIARGHYSADLSAFLPASPNAQQRVLIDQLQNGAAARTLLIGIEGSDAPARAAASRRLAAELRRSALFEQVQNGAWEADGAAGADGVHTTEEADASGWRGAGVWLYQHRYQLSPAVDAQRFTVEGLRNAIDDTLGLLGTPTGAAVKAKLAEDPTGELPLLVESLIPSAAPRIEDGVWVSRTQPRALLLASTRAAGADLDGQAQAQSRLQQAFAPLAAQGLRLQYSGPGVFAVQSRAQIEREVRQLAIVGTLVMGALLTLAFASWRALLVAFLPVATGVVAGIVAVSLGFGTVHGITLGFGSTLIGEAVDYAIYYLIQSHTLQGRGEGWRRWLREGWPTVRLGLWTSVCGFAALVFSGFPGLAQLGVFSIAGLMGAALCTRWVLPALMPDGAAGSLLRARLGRWAQWGVRTLPALRAPLWAAGALAAGWLLVHHHQVWRGDLASLSPVPAAAQALDASLRRDLSATDARVLVVAQGPSVEAALQAAEAAGARLDKLVQAGQLAGFESPTRVMPSQATQRARLASLPSRELLIPRLQAATQGGPLPAQRLQPFLDQVDAARRQAPVTPDQLRGTALGPMVDALLFRGSAAAAQPGAPDTWFALLALQALDDRPLSAAQVQASLQGLADVQVLDIKDALDSLYGRYLHEALWQAGLGAAGVVLLLGLYLRSGRRLLAVCQPLALAVLLTLGSLAALGLPLGILHLVGLLLVVAVGSNYALFFDQLQHEGRADDDTLASLLLANLTTVASFGLIAASHIPALSAIGQVVAPGALLALLLAACFVPRRGASPHSPVGKSVLSLPIKPS